MIAVNSTIPFVAIITKNRISKAFEIMFGFDKNQLGDDNTMIMIQTGKSSIVQVIGELVQIYT